MIIASAPVRISFFGGGTDYPEYFLREGGAGLATAIDKFSYVAASPFLSHLFDCAMRISYRKVELVRAVGDRWSLRLAREVFPLLTKRRPMLTVEITNTPFLDIGTPEILAEPETFIRQNRSQIGTAWRPGPPPGPNSGISSD